MGIVNFGIPTESVKWLKEALKLKVLIEGGTYTGGTAKQMAQIFDRVYTIEKSENMYEISKNNLKEVKNVLLLKGDTRDYIKELMYENDDILFWLDAHWSGGETYGADDECPLLEELALIFQFDKNFVVLIDDARLFLSPPPLPHKFYNWPSYSEIIKLLPDKWETLVFEDVIYVFPDKIADQFNIIIQRLITEKKSSSKKNRKNYLSKLIRFFAK